jgi:hypothetical protein
VEHRVLPAARGVRPERPLHRALQACAARRAHRSPHPKTSRCCRRPPPSARTSRAASWRLPTSPRRARAGLGRLQGREPAMRSSLDPGHVHLHARAHPGGRVCRFPSGTAGAARADREGDRVNRFRRARRISRCPRASRRRAGSGTRRLHRRRRAPARSPGPRIAGRRRISSRPWRARAPGLDHRANGQAIDLRLSPPCPESAREYRQMFGCSARPSAWPQPRRRATPAPSRRFRAMRHAAR